MNKNKTTTGAIKDHSSAIEEIAYNGGDSELRVTFNTGEVYAYYNVPRAVVAEVIGAESMGSAFHQKIKNTFECDKLNV